MLDTLNTDAEVCANCKHDRTAVGREMRLHSKHTKVYCNELRIHSAELNLMIDQTIQFV